MKKIDLQNLSTNDKLRLQTFCKIIAIGMVRLEKEIQPKVTNNCAKVS